MNTETFVGDVRADLFRADYNPQTTLSQIREDYTGRDLVELEKTMRCSLGYLATHWNIVGERTLKLFDGLSQIIAEQSVEQVNTA